MNIGIDIDGVLANDDDFIFDHVTKFCYENNLETWIDPYQYEYNKLAWDHKIIDKYRAKYFWQYIKEEPPRKFASEIIQKLKEDGHHIYIITSRHFSEENSEEGEKMRNITKQWLQKHNIFYDDIYFVNDKTKPIQKLNIDIMIEDSPETIPIFVNYTHVLCFDCRYNRHLHHPNLTRVFSWYDIYMNIKNRVSIDNP